MKIAFVFPPMWTPHSDGSLQIWNREVTTRLSKSCDVLVYAGHPGVSSVSLDDNVGGVQYRRFSTRWDNRFLKRLQFIHRTLGIRRPLYSTDLWYLFYALKVALDIRKQGCDLVHVYYYPQFANLIKRLNPKLRVILNNHGESMYRVKYTNIKKRLRKIDLVVSCSDFVTKYTCEMFPEFEHRCTTVPMGLSPDCYSRHHHKVSPDNPSPRRLLSVSRIAPEKGIHVLLEAFELIAREDPHATLTLVGPEWIAPREDIVDLCLDKAVAAGLDPFYKGSYLLQLKQKLSPEAAKRVTFAGLVAHNDVPAYYANSDIYVSATLHESFGMSVIEAMAAGLPVVAPRIKAFEDLISDGQTGLLVEEINPSAIAAAVLKLFKNPELGKSISCAAREMVCAQFSWDTISSSLLQLYREVLGTQRASLDYAECVRE